MITEKRRKPNRIKGYDYSAMGVYFVTTCVQERKCVFGKIENGEIILNKYGEIIKTQWEWLEKRYPYVRADDFCIMPNHFHGILWIQIQNLDDCVVGTGRDLSDVKGRDLSENKQAAPERPLHNNKKATPEWPLPENQQNPDNPPPIKIKSLSQIMGAFKTTTSHQIHEEGFLDFSWQRSFYDHIFRNEKDLDRIRKYIQNNPWKWEEDKYFTLN